jgi:DNA-binding MarR family transcriptional regulator
VSDLEAVARQCFALHARMTARALTRAYDAAVRPAGLRVTQFSVLGAIALELDLSETKLAERLAVERTTLVRNLKLLADKGWIEPVAGGRGQRHRLTAAGRAVLEAAVPLWQAAQAAITAKLADRNPDDVRDALRALRRASR